MINTKILTTETFDQSKNDVLVEVTTDERVYTTSIGVLKDTIETLKIRKENLLTQIELTEAEIDENTITLEKANLDLDSVTIKPFERIIPEEDVVRKPEPQVELPVPNLL